MEDTKEVVGETYVFPAEFEPQERVWLSWPHDPREVIKDRPFHPVVLDMAEALLPHVKVAIIVNDLAVDRPAILSALHDRTASSSTSSSSSSSSGPAKEDELVRRLEFHQVTHQSVWMRDFGPIFVRPERRDSTAKQKVVAFKWSIWGYADRLRAALSAEEVEAMLDEGEVARRVAHALELDTIEADIVSEGGDREFNGKGTLMVTEAVQLQRNPHLSKEELTERYKRIFNVKKVIWLKRGVAEDDQIFAGPLPGYVFNMPCTGGHIDEYARFVSPTTILLAQVREEDREHPIGRISHERLEENYRILADETDQDGNPFTIIRLPLPPIETVRVTPADPLYQEYELHTFEGAEGGPKTFKQLLEERRNAKRKQGESENDDESVEAVVPASYCNFLISNGVVLIPRYHTGDGSARDEEVKRTDETARSIIQAAFPEHMIVQIACENVNFGGGGMHCISQQQPRV